MNKKLRTACFVAGLSVVAIGAMAVNLAKDSHVEAVEKNHAQAVPTASKVVEEAVGRALSPLDETRRENTVEKIQAKNEPPPQLVSLRGASVPDVLRLDENGDLVKDQDTQLLFDFFMAGIQDVGEADLQVLVEDWLGQHLQGKAAGSAVDLWRRYLGYQKILSESADANLPDLASFDLNSDLITRFESVMQERHSLRQQWLPDVAENWFAADEALDQETLTDLRSRVEGGTQSSAAATAYFSPRLSQENNAEYDRRLAQVRATNGLAVGDRAEQEDQLRAQYFPDRAEYVRQALRDISR
ncbi:Hypothetical protein HDN1F_22630 [gamma proteobacterium HdN1]|nr:Hypothetical protein HDN1F_22630 [gamma proteobacterium HdN1]